MSSSKIIFASLGMAWNNKNRVSQHIVDLIPSINGTVSGVSH